MAFISENDGRIGGFYAISTGGVEPSEAPARTRSGVAAHPVPVILLTRMGVDMSMHGAGLGTAMLVDACLRVARISEEVGIRALLIHAKDERARQFYLSFAEFEESPTDPLHLFLLLKDLRRAVKSSD